jgi:hypothetical protein
MTGVKELFFDWLGREHPELRPIYADLYARGSRVPGPYLTTVRARVNQALRRHHLPVPDTDTSDKFALLGKRAPAAESTEPTLF